MIPDLPKNGNYSSFKNMQQSKNEQKNIFLNYNQQESRLRQLLISDQEGLVKTKFFQRPFSRARREINKDSLDIQKPFDHNECASNSGNLYQIGDLFQIFEKLNIDELKKNTALPENSSDH